MKDVFEAVCDNINKEQQNKNNMLVRGSKVNAAVLNENEVFEKLKKDWGGVHEEAKLRYVAKELKYYEREFNDEGENATTAKAFESLMNYCISSIDLRWLGNKWKRVNTQEGPKDVLDYNVRSTSGDDLVSDYDDKRHRVDSVVTIRLGQTVRREHNYNHAENPYLQIGLDCTIARRPLKGDLEYSSEEKSRKWSLKHFSDKISRSNNEPTAYQKPVPFGFSQVDFYQNSFERKPGVPDVGGLKGMLEQIPRFVVGIDKDLAKYVRDNCVNDNGRLKNPTIIKNIAENNPILDGIRFKMTSEIATQADMMMHMMPENIKEDAELFKDWDKLRVLKELMDAAMVTSAKAAINSIINTKTEEGRRLAMSLGQETDGKKRAKILEQFYRDPKNEKYDATYDGILEATESFVDYSRNIQGTEQDLRTLQARNRAFRYENGVLVDMKKEAEEKALNRKTA